MVPYDASHIQQITGRDDFREGLFMVERAGTYYLSWSIDDTGSEDYRVGYATATSPTGPFTNRGGILSKNTTLGIKGTGHSSMLRIPGTDDWYLAYHRFANLTDSLNEGYCRIRRIRQWPSRAIGPPLPKQKTRFTPPHEHRFNSVHIIFLTFIVGLHLLDKGSLLGNDDVHARASMTEKPIGARHPDAVSSCSR